MPTDNSKKRAISPEQDAEERRKRGRQGQLDFSHSDGHEATSWQNFPSPSDTHAWNAAASSPDPSLQSIAIGSSGAPHEPEPRLFGREGVDTVPPVPRLTTHDRYPFLERYDIRTRAMSAHAPHPSPRSVSVLLDQRLASATRSQSRSATRPPASEDLSISAPSINFNASGSRLSAGRDIGSGNVSQYGGGNIHVSSLDIHSTISAEDDHAKMLTQITEKLQSYIVAEAVLSKDIHGEPSTCYAGTRGELLNYILHWLAEGSAEDGKETGVSRWAKCIVGAPGSGKSTIMNTLVINLLNEASHRVPGLIAAHYCIRRDQSSTTDHNKIIPTLILQLARQDAGIAMCISQSLLNQLQTGILATKFMEELFIQAIQSYQKTVFLIVDALDEASSPASLATLLSRVIPASPPNLRLLLATRNKHGVLQGLGKGLVPKIVHEIPTEKSRNEVGDYIIRRLRDGVRQIFGDDSAWSFWPADSQLQSLSRKAGGLFIWATTAVDYILSKIARHGNVDRDRWIKDVENLGTADVNSLYMFILEKQMKSTEEGDPEDDMIRVRMTEVFGSIIVAERPLRLDVLVGLLDFHDFDVIYFVSLARSILVPGTKRIIGSTIPRMHKTFFDFVTTERAAAFHVDVKDHHCKAADRCFAVMASKLSFNIADLRSSFSHLGDRDKLAASIPRLLVYASTQWRYRLDKTGDNQLPSDLAHIQAFLGDKLLFWLEVIVLLDEAKAAQDWLHGLGIRLAHRQSDSDFEASQLDLAAFTQDASTLINKFKECIEVSIPHIYISLLAFSPGNSIVANHYRKQITITVIPHPSQMPQQWDSWDADPRMVNDDSPRSISFSPCGRRLAAGYDSGIIRVWDAETGKCEKEPLEGHSEQITSVCFSPSGLLVASGSTDATIRVWDAETGRCMHGPLTGALSSVFSVSFSPDSSRIVAGFGGGFIRVWDVRTGELVLDPLDRHASSVSSVSYSPDGSFIASSSTDTTIRLWNAQTGWIDGYYIPELPAGQQGHIPSLSFHPDGHWLVFCSDKTIQIWDARKGTSIHGPLSGHTDTVCSVCFSPNGRYIASVSHDRTFRIWDTETAICVAGPFGSAGGCMSCVTFSPDGKHLATGSLDGTVILGDFQALLSTGIRDSAACTKMEITDYTTQDYVGWTLGTNGKRLFWTPQPFSSAIWRPSIVRILGRPAMVKPDLSRLVTGEEWLQCFSTSTSESKHPKKKGKSRRRR